MKINKKILKNDNFNFEIQIIVYIFAVSAVVFGGVPL